MYCVLCINTNTIHNTIRFVKGKNTIRHNTSRAGRPREGPRPVANTPGRCASVNGRGSRRVTQRIERRHIRTSSTEHSPPALRGRGKGRLRRSPNSRAPCQPTVASEAHPSELGASPAAKRPFPLPRRAGGLCSSKSVLRHLSEQNPFFSPFMHALRKHRGTWKLLKSLIGKS